MNIDNFLISINVFSNKVCTLSFSHYSEMKYICITGSNSFLSGATTIGGNTCFIAQYGCPNHGGPADGSAQTNGSVHRDGNDHSEEQCLNRALQIWRYCGSYRNHPFTAVYGPTGTSDLQIIISHYF